MPDNAGDRAIPLRLADLKPRVQQFASMEPQQIDGLLKDSGSDNYIFMSDPLDRQKIKAGIMRLLEKSRQEGIECVVAEGFSTKPLAHSFLRGWGRLYGPESVPALFSFGDSIVDTPGIIHHETEDEADGNKRIFQLASGKTVEEVAERVRGRFPRLMDYRSDPLLVLSEYVRFGKSMKAIENIMECLGFSNVSFGGLIICTEDYDHKRIFDLKKPLWRGEDLGHHPDGRDYPDIPWIHLRSRLYNQLKFPKDQQDPQVIHALKSASRVVQSELNRVVDEI